MDRLRSAEPFPSGAAMLARAREILTELSEAEQIAVINALIVKCGKAIGGVSMNNRPIAHEAAMTGATVQGLLM